MPLSMLSSTGTPSRFVNLNPVAVQKTVSGKFSLLSNGLIAFNAVNDSAAADRSFSCVHGTQAQIEATFTPLVAGASEVAVLDIIQLLDSTWLGILIYA